MNELFPTIIESPTGWWYFVPYLIFAFIAIIGFSFLDKKDDIKSQKIGKQLAYGGGILTLVTVIIGLSVMLTISFENKNSRVEASKSQAIWVLSHGVTPDAKGFKDLNFPDVKPTEDTKFGIAQVVKDKKIVTIHLAWENDEFVLYGTDGQPLKQIK